jgi:hypothetical protein
MKTRSTLLLFFICFTATAQKSDSTRTYYRIIRGGMIEHATELRTKRYVKNGLSEIKAGKTLVATGLYKEGKRYGRWRFFKTSDTVDQIYNYTTKKVEYSLSRPDFSYEIDSLKNSDQVIYPVKIGGSYFAFFFLWKQYTPPHDLRPYKGIHKAYLIFHINEKGILTKYETKVTSSVYNKTSEIKLKNLREEDFDFMPAIVNGKPVASKIIYESKITVD